MVGDGFSGGSGRKNLGRPSEGSLMECVALSMVVDEGRNGLLHGRRELRMCIAGLITSSGRKMKIT